MPLGAGTRVAAPLRALREAELGSTQFPGQPPRLCLLGGRGEAGGGRPSSRAPSLPHPPIKKGLRCRSAGSPGEPLRHRARRWARFWAGSASPGTPPHGASHCQRSSSSACRPGFLALPGLPQDPSGPGACPSEASPAAVGVGSALAPLCAPRCPVRGPPPLCIAQTSRPSLPSHLRGEGAAPGVRQKVSDPPSVLPGLLGLLPPPPAEVPPGPCSTWARGSRGPAPLPAPQGSSPSSRGGQASSRRPPSPTTGSYRPALGAGGGG